MSTNFVLSGRHFLSIGRVPLYIICILPFHYTINDLRDFPRNHVILVFNSRRQVPVFVFFFFYFQGPSQTQTDLKTSQHFLSSRRTMSWGESKMALERIISPPWRAQRAQGHHRRDRSGASSLGCRPLLCPCLCFDLKSSINISFFTNSRGGVHPQINIPLIYALANLYPGFQTSLCQEKVEYMMPICALEKLLV